MSFVNRPLKRELSRLGPISPEIDSMLDELYQALDDPTFQGDPTEFLLRIDEMWGEHDPKDKLEEYPGLEEMEPDPGMFPEDTDFDIAALLTPETLDVDLLSCFNNSKYLRRMMHRGPVFRKLAQDPSFSEVLDRIGSFLGKPIDSNVGAPAGEPEKQPRWTRRKLGHAKKKADPKPKRLGPEGTWMNDPGHAEVDRTQTPVQRSTITPFKRQDTLKD